MTGDEVFGLLIVLAVLGLLIKGGIQTFQRNWAVAILMLIFIFPIWLCWALVEVFLAKPIKQPIEVKIVKEQLNEH